MTNRIICCFTLSFLLGILFEKEKSLWFVMIFLLLMIYTSIVIYFHYRSRAWKVILFRGLASLLVFCAGAEHFQKEQEKWNMLDGILKEEDKITICGKIYQKEEKTKQYLYYLTDTQVFVGDTIYPCYGILIYSSNQHFQLGNILQVTGKNAPFQIPRNEGNFNEKQYYQSKKIEIRLYAQEELLISKEKNKYTIFLEDLRQRLKKSYRKSMSTKNAGMMVDMTLGDKSLLENTQKSLYQKVGISHILAISGLHVSLFGMGVLWLLQKLLFPKKVAILLAIGVVYSFGVMSGMEISTMRAILMFLLFMIAEFFGYSYDSLTALSVSASIQIWENPFVLQSVGFLFSYAAVLGVVVVAQMLKGSKREEKTQRNKKEQLERKQRQLNKERQLEKRQRQLNKKEQLKAKRQKVRENQQKNFLKERETPTKREVGKEIQKNGIQKIWKYFIEKLKETIFVSICIQLVTLPLSLYFYYEISSYSVIINGCILPFLGILLILGIIGAFVGSFYFSIGKILLTPVEWMLCANEWLCKKILSLPGAVLLIGKPDRKLLVIYYILLALSLYLLWYGTSKKWMIGTILAFVIVLFLRKNPQFEINVLDVGQGDGIFIQTEEGEHFFIDGGSSDVNQVGKYRILPFLKSRGIHCIKGWIISHADKDHISGLEEILEEGYPIEYLIVAEGMVKDKAAEKLLKLAKDSGCKILSVKPNMKFGTKKLVFTVLHPNSIIQTEVDRNSMSLVISLEYDGFTGIFTGDIGTEQEQTLLEKYYLENISSEKSSDSLCDIDFYKAAHHGSNASNSKEFLNLLSPKVTVISCSEKNSYGHPGKEALKRIESTGSQIFCTKEKGQIIIRPKNGTIQILYLVTRRMA